MPTEDSAAGTRRKALTAPAVEATFEACYSPKGEVLVDGIMSSAHLDRAALADHAELVAAMLLELPDEYMKSKGGGWSFLNACDDKTGEQWTGMHSTMDKLFMLGMGIGMVECQLPRDMWVVLPGGMPYYVVNDGASS